MILLDTHSLLWLVNGSDRLGKIARRRCEELARTRELMVSAISFWEVAFLARRNRIELGSSPSSWRDAVLRTGIGELPLDGAAAVEGPFLPALHADPGDQLIVASAIRHGATLLTADERILAWRGQLLRQDARR